MRPLTCAIRRRASVRRSEDQGATGRRRRGSLTRRGRAPGDPVASSTSATSRAAGLDHPLDQQLENFRNAAASCPASASVTPTIRPPLDEIECEEGDVLEVFEPNKIAVAPVTAPSRHPRPCPWCRRAAATGPVHTGNPRSVTRRQPRRGHLDQRISAPNARNYSGANLEWPHGFSDRA